MKSLSLTSLSGTSLLLSGTSWLGTSERESSLETTSTLQFHNFHFPLRSSRRCR